MWDYFVLFVSKWVKYIYLILLLFCIVFLQEGVYLHEKHAVTNLVSGPKLVVRSFRALVQRIRTDNRMSERPSGVFGHPAGLSGFHFTKSRVIRTFRISGTLVPIRVSKNIILHDELKYNINDSHISGRLIGSNKILNVDEKYYKTIIDIIEY